MHQQAKQYHMVCLRGGCILRGSQTAYTRAEDTLPPLWTLHLAPMAIERECIIVILKWHIFKSVTQSQQIDAPQCLSLYV